MIGFLSNIVTPLTYILLPLLISFYPKLHRRIKITLRGASILFALFFTNPSLYALFERNWYTPYDTTTTPTNKTYRYGIVLGGYAFWDHTRNRPEFSEIGDRLFEGLNLYHQGRIKKLIIASDGTIIDTPSNPNIKGNPEAMRRYIISLGVKPEDLILETKANNTHENATFTLQLIGDSLRTQPTLLITSAIHMKRSMLAFRQVGLNPDPWITDTQLERDKRFTIIPSVATLTKWPALQHEWIGYLAYKSRY
ncbi:YdcF family protein [uncultured Bacteroides sp.]|uniref:YdcF family protein n=1 Tax=uncultured Bacteroides sp. TaxID=162156 RepID=UPI002615F39F|nr:YdcF family protein [uncultured Bacteroides sp.]